jgi:mannonate dehydratase
MRRAGGVLVLLLAGFVGGAFAGPPSAIPAALSPEARELLRAAYDGVDAAALFDHPTHLVGIGSGGTGCRVNPAMRSPAAPFRHLRFEVYKQASGIRDEARADQEYVARLLELVDASPNPGRHLLLAFDHHYGPDGTRNLDLGEFHVPNDHALAVAEARPDRFVAAMSVHPYRKDAIAELRRLAARGVRVIKGLPNAMGIDPADPALDPYYDAVRELGPAILTHAGEEKAVESGADQELGNPCVSAGGWTAAPASSSPTARASARASTSTEA